MNFKKLASIVSVALLLGNSILMAESADPRVKALLQEGLRLYSERQYVRALDLFKQAKSIDPSNKTADEYIVNSEQRILEWETQSEEYIGNKKPNTTWDSLLESNKRTGGVESITNARDIIATRRSLVDRMKNRSLNTDNIVKIEDSKNGFTITLFHDQLFLPGLQTLRDESLPILANVASLIRTSGDKEVNIKSVSHSDSKDPFLLYPETDINSADPDLPQTSAASSFLFEDIESTRALILFTYIAQKSMGKSDRNLNE